MPSFSLSLSHALSPAAYTRFQLLRRVSHLHTHIQTPAYLTHLYMCSHTHTHTGSSSAPSLSLTFAHTAARAHLTHLHMCTHSYTHTHTHSLLRRMNPKRGAQEEVQQLAAFDSLPFPALLMRFAAFCSSICSHYYYCCCCLFVFLIMRFGFINSYKAAAAYHAW